MIAAMVENYSLKRLNSFGFDVTARYLLRAANLEQLRAALSFARHRKLPVLVLGEGSNVVLRSNLDGLVLKPEIRGIQVTSETASAVSLAVGAGENWDSFVHWCLARGYFGLENLSLIPGSVGAAPVQNIGAYGVEVKDFIASVEALDRSTGESVMLDRDACHFAYRDSLFKSAAGRRYIICRVNFRLSKQARPNIGYGAIKAALQAVGAEVTPQAVSEAVCELRRAKLPDPATLGNAGSFFKNPVISNSHYARLKQCDADLVAYPDRPGFSKLAAGWLIDRCGWKGYREADIGVHAEQALVLVNYGTGTPRALLDLAASIRDSVARRFDVALEIEPSIYPAPGAGTG